MLIWGEEVQMRRWQQKNEQPSCKKCSFEMHVLFISCTLAIRYRRCSINLQFSINAIITHQNYCDKKMIYLFIFVIILEGSERDELCLLSHKQRDTFVCDQQSCLKAWVSVKELVVVKFALFPSVYSFLPSQMVWWERSCSVKCF